MAWGYGLRTHHVNPAFPARHTAPCRQLLGVLRAFPRRGGAAPDHDTIKGGCGAGCEESETPMDTKRRGFGLQASMLLQR